MESTSEKEVQDKASSGKNEPMAKSPKPVPNQNGELRPSKKDAAQQSGTDESRRHPEQK